MSDSVKQARFRDLPGHIFIISRVQKQFWF